MTEGLQQKVHALWMFDVEDTERAAKYFEFAIEKLPGLGMRAISMGRFRASERGDLKPRQFYILGEWESEEAFRQFGENSDAADDHANREDSTTNTIRHLFDGIMIIDPNFQVSDIARLINP